MSNFYIPNGGQIRQIGRSETLGEILESFSIDINNPYGKIQPSKKLVKVLDETDFEDNTRVLALSMYQADAGSAPYYFAVGEETVLQCATNDDPTDPSNWGWNEATTISTAGFDDGTDAVVFDNLLLISRTQNILSWDGGTDDDDWGTTEAGFSNFTSGYPHTMHVHRSGAETLVVTNNNQVRYYNEDAGVSTVTLSEGLVACCLDSTNDAIWAGTYTKGADTAYVYEIYIGEQFDGTPIARNAYKIPARAVLSIATLDGIPYIITDRGNLMAFNGAGFVTVAQLPFSGSNAVLDGVRMGSVDDDNDERPVHPKGMRAHNDSIFINVRTQTEQIGVSNQDPYAKNSPSGVWEYNTVTRQLHHRSAFSNTANNNGAKVTRYGGPLLIVDTPQTLFMAGAEINDTTAGLFMEGTTRFGYFVTPEIMSQSVTDAHESVYIKSKTLTGNDNIKLKYRTTKRDPQYASVTLSGANVINTTDTLSVEVGDEVTIIDGAPHGAIAHITDIQMSDTVTVITLDTDIGTMGQTGTAEFLNFKLEPEAYTSESGEVKRFGGYGNNPWVQFKVVMEGDVEVRQFISHGNAKEQL